MEFIGNYLKNVRIKKNLKIELISKELNINFDILLNIESDCFPEHLNRTYLIGYIRTYSKFLNLDEDLIVKNFKIQTSYNNLNFKKEISKPIQIKNIISFSKGLSFVSFFIIILSFYFLFFEPNAFEKDYAMTPDVPENLKYNLEKAEMELALDSDLYKLSKFKSNKSKIINMIKIQNDNLINSSSAIASLPKENIKNIRKDITLKFLNATWIQLRNKDDQIILSKLMNKNDEFSYDISENLSLTSGNAGNIIVLLSGQVVGKIGKLGEVIDSLIIDKNFNQ